jgi:small subunit ribosomal protein S13
MRITGVTIPENKQLEFGLTTIFGIGRPSAKAICTKLGIDYTKKPEELSSDQELALRKEIEAMETGGSLNRKIQGHIKRLIDINSYRGSRHSKNLPARGQRTKTNSRTVRGNKRNTAGSGRIKVSKT